MAKAKVVVTIAGDAYKIAQNIWKAISGSAHVKRIPSNSAAAKNAKNLSSTNAAKIKINTARVKIGAQNRQTGEALKKLSKESKVKLKSGPLDVKPKPKTKTTNGTKTSSTTKKSPWSTTKSKTTSSTQAQRLRDADVSKGTKITSTNAKSGNIVTRGGKRAGVIVTKGGKKFIQTKTGKLIAIGAAGAGGYYLGKAIDKSIAGTNGAATTSSGAATTTKPKPPKPSGPVTTAPAPPSVLSAQEQAANKPKPQQSGPSGGPPQRQPTKTEPKTFEQKLKDKFVKFRGGEEAFGKKGSDAAWKTHVLDMRRGSEVGLTYKDTQDYDKIIEERKGATKKKRGGVIKRNKGGPVRGVGKALRGYGNNSIYSNKMY